MEVYKSQVSHWTKIENNNQAHKSWMHTFLPLFGRNQSNLLQEDNNRMILSLSTKFVYYVPCKIWIYMRFEDFHDVLSFSRPLLCLSHPDKIWDDSATDLLPGERKLVSKILAWPNLTTEPGTQSPYHYRIKRWHIIAR
jgi:hypothetical protein